MGTFADIRASKGALSDTVSCFETHWEHRIITARELEAMLLGFSLCL